MCYLGTSVSVDTAFMYIPKDCSLLASLGPAMLFSSALSAQLVNKTILHTIIRNNNNLFI